MFRIESDNSFPDEKHLCDIFTTKERAEKEAEERNKRASWHTYVNYTVEEWEIQE